MNAGGSRPVKAGHQFPVGRIDWALAQGGPLCPAHRHRRSRLRTSRCCGAALEYLAAERERCQAQQEVSTSSPATCCWRSATTRPVSPSPTVA
ncbi:hypothetical protein BAE44_0022151 [Dichanthelium oligosanthes]|uniref:Uncharacterized protein n=1 Tax=Dichanthelium oligosanthes TaxID=888268 RepID=A0A1E5UVI7_9POAL|nr:hypothetical protein BAE44_0022151 [Dichanthelium oligosanthes]